MKTAELKGFMLDYWAARAAGLVSHIEPFGTKENKVCVIEVEPWSAGAVTTGNNQWIRRYSPSTDWTIGGPLMERERISPMPTAEDSERSASGKWSAQQLDTEGWHSQQYGDTMLEAAMRCLVACKYGDEVPDMTTKYPY